MALKLGSNDVSKVYLGSNEITKAYLGSNIVLEPAPGPGGFDPTLGGTLSPAHWWDMTDVANMTINGNSIEVIGDKGSSAFPEEISVANGWNYVAGFPTYDSGKAYFAQGGSAIYKSATWPNDMVSQGSPNTWVFIAQLDPLATLGQFYALTGNRTGYEALHQGMVGYDTGGTYRAATWNDNNGAPSSTTPHWIFNSNKAGSNYGSFYAGFDPTVEFMYAGFQSMNSSGATYMKNSLNGLPMAGQTPTYTESTSRTGYMAIAGSGLEITFSRFANFNWHGWISHIIVYDNTELTDAQLAALQAGR